MSTFKHSTVLFTGEDAQPLKFYMRPCAEKQRLRPLIEHGGGVLTSKSSEEMYHLIEPGCKIFTTADVCFSSQFIWDCVEKNCLQDIEKYKITVGTTEISDISEDETSKYKIRTTKRSLRSRSEYTDEDDYTILDYIIKSNRYKEAKGRSIWVNLQNRKVLSNRTWQSLKERYIKKIIPNIDKYNISEKHKMLLSGMFKVSDGASDISSSSKSFTFSDDLSILHNLFQADRFHRLHDDEMWKEVECTVQTKHSWESLKDRFFKRIIPSLDIFDLTPQQISELKSVVKIPSLVLSLAQNKAKSERPELGSAGSALVLKEPAIVLDKAELDQITTDTAENRSKDVLEKPSAEAVDSTSLQLAQKNNTFHIQTPTPPSSSDENSDISIFENNCVMNYEFQKMEPKVLLKKLSMKAIQKPVAEIDKPSRSPEVESHEHNLKSMENENHQAITSNDELASEEISLVASLTLATIHEVTESLDKEWSESSDKSTLKLISEKEESDGTHNRTNMNVEDDEERRGTFEISTAENLHQNKVCSDTKNINGVDAKSKEHFVTPTNLGIIRSFNNNWERSSSSRQTDESFDNNFLKYQRLRRSRKAANQRNKSNNAQNAMSSLRTMPFFSRKRHADNIRTADSEVSVNKDTTLSSLLNIALEYVKNIKEECMDWSDFNNASVPVNVVQNLDKLHILLYKIHLTLSSSEIMKKPKDDITNDDIITLLKFIIVHGNYNFEDISKMF